MDHEAGPSRQRSVFSCSPRDFHLPQSIIEVEDVAVPRTPESRIPIPAKRHTPARCVPAVLRDKNKMRVAELLQEERAPSCFEIASEARLQRHLMGQTLLQDHVSRRVRRSRIAQERGGIHGPVATSDPSSDAADAPQTRFQNLSLIHI